MVGFADVRRAVLAAVVLAGAAIAATAPAKAGDDSGSGQNYYAGLSCSQLWYERNSIFAQRGFCFTTRRAINTFGPRCYAPFGQLPGNLRRVVAEIKRWESRRGC